MAHNKSESNAAWVVAEKIHIAGEVRDAVSGQHLGDACVQIRDSQIMISCDASGQFYREVDFPFANNIELVVTAGRYKERSVVFAFQPMTIHLKRGRKRKLE